jgi:hypothetical protein
MAGDLVWGHMHPVLVPGSNITLWRRILKILGDKYKFNTVVPGHGDISERNTVIEMEEYFNSIAEAGSDKRKLNELKEKFRGYVKFPYFAGVDRVAGMIKRENKTGK